jgi:hypothetical protein
VRQNRKEQSSPVPTHQHHHQQRAIGAKPLIEVDLSVNQDLAPIYLDVGGCVYTSTLDTLTKHGESRLAKLFNGSLPIVHDAKKNNYFIDRDGASFRHILNYLRTGKLIVPEHFDELDQLLEEARFFELDQMIKLIEDSIEQKKSQMNKRKLENNESLISKVNKTIDPQQQQQLIDSQLKAFLLRTAFRNPSLTASSSACSQEDPSEDTSAQSPASSTTTNNAQPINNTDEQN